MMSQNSEVTEALDLTRFHPCLLSVSYPAAPRGNRCGTCVSWDPSPPPQIK